jgi:hypothetical protein
MPGRGRRAGQTTAVFEVQPIATETKEIVNITAVRAGLLALVCGRVVVVG